jgi:hypothetical protein
LEKARLEEAKRIEAEKVRAELAKKAAEPRRPMIVPPTF